MVDKNFYKQSICVMYHYVRSNVDEKTPNLNSLSIPDFESQLDFFQENMNPLNYEEYENCINQNLPFPKNKFVLTFDDGLMDHYKNVYPILKKRGLWGFFFINSKIYLENKPLDVHLVHLLIDKLGVDKIYEKVQTSIRENNINLHDFNDKNLYRYDKGPKRNLKILLNYQIDYENREMLIKDLYSKIFCNYNDFCKQFYCSIEHLKEMSQNNMIIGSHTHSHKVLSRLSKKMQEIEIEKCSTFLRDKLEIRKQVFCFPYGGNNSFTRESQDLLRKHKHTSAFTTIRGPLNITDGRFSLKRYDTVDLKID